jgi:hypothetical protein
MTRRLLNLLTLLSLVLCVAAGGLWAWSYTPERVWVRFVDGSAMIVATDGWIAHHLGGNYFNDKPNRGSGAREFLREMRANRPPFALSSGIALPFTRAEFLGVETYHVAAGPASVDSYRVIVVPLAYLFVPAAVAPAVWTWARQRRRMHARSGRCVRCGYDLRATPGRCPECGTTGIEA